MLSAILKFHSHHHKIIKNLGVAELIYELCLASPLTLPMIGGNKDAKVGILFESYLKSPTPKSFPEMLK